MGDSRLHKAWLLAVMLAATATTAPAAGDIKGSRDSPFLKRYEGSTIEHYEKKAFADFRFLLGPLPKRPEKEQVKTRTAEGPYTRLAYLIPEGRSSLEVLRNYEEELKARGGRIVYECRHRRAARTWSAATSTSTPRPSPDATRREAAC